MFNLLMTLVSVWLVIKLICRMFEKFITKMFMYNTMRDYFTNSEEQDFWNRNRNM